MADSPDFVEQIRTLEHMLYNWASSVDSNRIIHLPSGTFDANNATEALFSLGINADALGYLFRKSKDMPFCESRYGGIFYGGITTVPQDHYPERGSVISSSVIILCGLNMMFTWRHDSGLLHVIAALFTLNGFAACLAHYYGTIAYFHFDSKTMLLAVWLALGFILSELFENVFGRVGLVGPRARCIRNTVNAFVWLFCLGAYWWVAETNMAIGNYEIGTRIGPMAVIAPMILVICAYLCLTGCCFSRMVHVMGKTAFRKARCRFIFGFFMALFGVTCWFLTEINCDRDDLVGTLAKWFPGHFMWHITMAYGCQQCLLFGGALRADNFQANVCVDSGTPWSLWRLYLFVFPRLLLTPKNHVYGVGNSKIVPMPLPHDDADDEYPVEDAAAAVKPPSLKPAAGQPKPPATAGGPAVEDLDP